jgi:hypothetical protein
MNRTMFLALLLAPALLLATTTITITTTAFAQTEEELKKNCENGNAFACGKLNGNEAQVNPKSGTITQCQPIPNEPPICVDTNVQNPQ